MVAEFAQIHVDDRKLGMVLYFENLPPIRRHAFRDSKCARQTFMIGGASAAGRMKVYFENPPPNRRHEFRDAKCARRTFMGGGASTSGRMKVYRSSIA